MIKPKYPTHQLVQDLEDAIKAHDLTTDLTARLGTKAYAGITHRHRALQAAHRASRALAKLQAELLDELGRLDPETEIRILERYQPRRGLPVLS